MKCEYYLQMRTFPLSMSIDEARYSVPNIGEVIHTVRARVRGMDNYGISASLRLGVLASIL